MDKTELASWLSDRDGHEIIGLRLVPPENDRRNVFAETLVELLATYPADRIVVEEQDRSAYIIHMYHPFGLDPPDPERWILIKPESPLFEKLRRQHDKQGKWGAGSL